jgi:hypothetical protein
MVVRIALVMGAWLAPLRAYAGNDDGILLGNDAALAGGAVVSSVNDGSALWYNPAGLALSNRDSVDVGASAFALRRYKMPGLISADGADQGDANFTEIVTIPSALTYVRRFGGGTVGGLALFASEVSDYALRTSLRVPIGTVVEGTFISIDADFQLLLAQETARYHLAAGLATKLPRGFTFGASLFGDYYDESGLAQTSARYSFTGQPISAQVESTYAQSKVLGYHLRVGMMYQATAALRLGLSVQSPGVYFYRTTRVTAVASATNPDDAGDLQLESGSADESDSEVGVGLYSPVRVRFGGSYELLGGIVSLEGDVASKLTNQDLEVRRTFTWNVRAGARFPISKTMHVGAGLFTDRGSERTDQWGAGNIDFYGATIGGSYDNVRWLAPDEASVASPATRSGLTFSSTVALRYAYGVGKLPGQVLTAPNYTAETRAVELGVHEITLHLGSGVYF